MDVPAAVSAVEGERPELAFKVGFHVQQLEPEHLRLERDGMRPVEPGRESLVNDPARHCRLLAHDLDGPLEDVAFPPRHAQDATPYDLVCRSIRAVDSTARDLVMATLPGVFTLLGVVAGAVIAWRIGRARETRDTRRNVYVEWLKAARLIGSWPTNLPTPTSGNVQIPHPVMEARLNEATTELSLVASKEVLETGNRYIEKVRSPGLTAEMSRPGLTGFPDAVDRFQHYLEGNRLDCCLSHAEGPRRREGLIAWSRSAERARRVGQTIQRTSCINVPKDATHVLGQAPKTPTYTARCPRPP